MKLIQLLWSETDPCRTYTDHPTINDKKLKLLAMILQSGIGSIFLSVSPIKETKKPKNLEK